MDGDVKVFELTCAGRPVGGRAGQARRGLGLQRHGARARRSASPRATRCASIVKNELPQSTAIHFHGLMVPNNDGRRAVHHPAADQARRDVHLRVHGREGNPGSHMYHSHHNAAEQVTKGLLGAFIIEPKDPSDGPAYDLEYTMVLNDGPHRRLHASTARASRPPQPLTAKMGQRVLIRYMNEGLMIHPMHLHGMPQTVDRQGRLTCCRSPSMCDTLNVAPGERCEVIVECDRAGRLGVPLPHPDPRRVRGRHVWHGHGADRRRVVVTRQPTGRLRRNPGACAIRFLAHGLFRERVGLRLTPSAFSSA